MGNERSGTGRQTDRHIEIAKEKKKNRKKAKKEKRRDETGREETIDRSSLYCMNACACLRHPNEANCISERARQTRP